MAILSFKRGFASGAGKVTCETPSLLRRFGPQAFSIVDSDCWLFHSLVLGKREFLLAPTLGRNLVDLFSQGHHGYLLATEKVTCEIENLTVVTRWFDASFIGTEPDR